MTDQADRSAGRARGERGEAIPFEAFEAAVTSPRTPPRESWRPVIVRLRPEERDPFLSLCDEARILVVDELDRQLADLARTRLPAGSATELESFSADFVDQRDGWYSCGVWVFLPWENRIAHLLDADSYFEVITNRNRDKITRAEQELLRTRTVGVMGLSLGAEAAVALAQEHLCGRLVLADFDRLDLSNLNRLNAGFDDLGLPKTRIAARRIARIDPFLDVELFEDGVTVDNAPEFLDGLDLLVEECDGLGMKFDVRAMARERGLNIVFAGDERGFLSVEPHALDPELAVFHGRIQQRQAPREAYPTPRAFLEELTEWLGGWDRISERTRRSLEKVGRELCGYPQLASEARFAAAQVGHVARRLLLGEHVRPFIGHVDLDEIVPSESHAD